MHRPEGIRVSSSGSPPGVRGRHKTIAATRSIQPQPPSGPFDCNRLYFTISLLDTLDGTRGRTLGDFPLLTNFILADIVVVKLAAPRRRFFARSGAARLAPRRPIPAANYISIDAVSPETVTRKTLLRYMVKSQYVNILLASVLATTPSSRRAQHVPPQFARMRVSSAFLTFNPPAAKKSSARCRQPSH